MLNFHEFDEETQQLLLEAETITRQLQSHYQALRDKSPRRKEILGQLWLKGLSLEMIAPYLSLSRNRIYQEIVKYEKGLGKRLERSKEVQKEVKERQKNLLTWEK